MSRECGCVASAAEGACFELCSIHLAGPELLEALEKMVNDNGMDFCCGDGMRERWAKWAKQALAREGEKQ